MVKRLLVLIIGIGLINSLVLWLQWPGVVLYNLAFLVLGGYLIMQYQSNLASMEQLQASQKQAMATQEQDYQLLVNKTRLMIDQLPIGLALINNRGLIEWLNPSFKQFIKNTSENNIYFYSDLRFCGEVHQLLKRAYEKRTAFLDRFKYQGLIYQSQVIPLVYKQQELGMLVIVQDITKALAGEQLQQQFIADASHELKTPLSVIVGMLELLNRDPLPPIEDQQQFIQVMQQESQRLTTIVSDLLQLSKMSSLKDVMQLQPVKIRQVVDAVIKSTESLKNIHPVTFDNQLSPQLEIMADQEKLYSVFSNLITNAIIHGQTHKIVVSAISQDQQLLISVRDYGTGIKEQDLPYIFDRFYRADSSRLKNTGGSGLGLAIVKDIITAHQGTITVQSVVNQGTTFTISLPN